MCNDINIDFRKALRRVETVGGIPKDEHYSNTQTAGRRPGSDVTVPASQHIDLVSRLKKARSHVPDDAICLHHRNNRYLQSAQDEYPLSQPRARKALSNLLPTCYQGSPESVFSEHPSPLYGSKNLEAHNLIDFAMP